MARSAKRAKARKRRRNAFQSGAIALGGMIASNPVLVGGSTAFMVTLFYVSANALWYQPFPHTGAFFATRSLQSFPARQSSEPVTTINIERPAEVPVPTAAPAPAHRDATVEQVQGILKDLGFYQGTVDGVSGPATQAAITSYQHKVGIAASGAIDDTLLEQLGAIPKTASVPPRPAPRPDTSSAAQPAPAQGADQRIIKIQAGLKAFGNNDIKLDGVIGARTKSAIREFQALFGLPETGEPDELTYNKMRETGLTN
ncbi:peptidoglycan-binding domain-containing protein [Mesorhizobium sp. SP-1A]|uniref:peptidoglycan-binding domain-containing protein n=1 Tax=Mesorhizobium sp. SP-1A TaxID=3077840 RepID=UPI0028F6CAE0|nr:peptidoglycan-binding domain-containing protein [Mesorhizobium sp. SP-1A]